MTGAASERARLEGWLGDPRVDSMVVGADSDGLVAGALLARARADMPGLPPLLLRGLYDMRSLFVDQRIIEPGWISRVVFVDADIRAPGARVLSNHVITWKGAPLAGLTRLPEVDLCNPNYASEWQFQMRGYEDKYPFSTSGWVAHLLEVDPHTLGFIGWGVLMAQDSAVLNARRYWENCLAWSRRLSPNPYTDLYDNLSRPNEHRLELDPTALRSAECRIKEATDQLRQRSPRAFGRGRWLNHQWHAQRLADEEGLHSFGQVAEVIARTYEVTASKTEVVAWRDQMPPQTTVVDWRVGDTIALEYDAPFSLARVQKDRVKMTVRWPAVL